jgi:hypothetical protein
VVGSHSASATAWRCASPSRCANPT